MFVAREGFDEAHDLFRTSFREFVTREIVPYHDAWEDAGIVDKAMFRRAGEMGFLGIDVPEDLGGGGCSDFRFNQIITEELQRVGVVGSGMCITLHNDVVLPYLVDLGTAEQQKRWIPGACAGTTMTAIAMTEPAMGSDLASMTTWAERRGDHYIVNGSKTFITSGINSDLVIVAVKTDREQRHRGMSLLVVEAGTPGFSRGRNLHKVGLKSQDTAELFFDNAAVDAENLLGEAGRGFEYLVGHLAQERLSVAMSAVAAASAAFELGLDYTKSRTAFGKPIGSFQHNRFALAEMRTEIDIAQIYIDRLVELHRGGDLRAEDAAAAKWWCTELQKRVVDRCVQLHGGYGYMLEYPIARAYLDARVQTIYGGTTEIMKEIVGRALGV